MLSKKANFYDDMMTFDDFAEVANLDHYVTAPNHWFVVIADIKDSTTAIAEGRYKEVNMIGPPALMRC
jgi:hypothetical protein